MTSSNVIKLKVYFAFVYIASGCQGLKNQYVYFKKLKTYFVKVIFLMEYLIGLASASGSRAVTRTTSVYSGAFTRTPSVTLRVSNLDR